MQELMRRANRLITNNRGSALVIAVVLGLIMAIAGIGFLFVTTSSTGNDSDAYARDRAFYAAESGALVAAKYFMIRSINSWGGAPNPFFLDKEINGFFVTVTSNIVGSQNTITAEAYASSTVKNASTFRKRVIIVVQNDGF